MNVQQVQQMVRGMPTAERLILGGTAAVVVGLLMPWYGASSSGAYGGVSASLNGFNSWGWLTFVALAAMVIVWALRHFASDAVQLPETLPADSVIFMVASGLELVGIVLFWVVTNGATITFTAAGGSFSSGLSVGWFIALVGALLTLAGGSTKRDPIVRAAAGSAPARRAASVGQNRG